MTTFQAVLKTLFAVEKASSDYVVFSRFIFYNDFGLHTELP